LQRPAVVLANEGFVPDGQSACSSKGMPAVRIVPETVPCECSEQEEADAGIRLAIPNIIEALSRPLSAHEAAPPPREKEEPARAVFSGQLEEVNRFFYKRGWGDGLPIVPPTEDAVREMLTGTDLPPDHLVGKIVPRLGYATVEKIAINAVMAGALPLHMPVLLACVEAILDPGSRFSTYNVSTGSWAPFWMINGPIRHDARVNSGSGALSPGDIANAVIGRAMGLVVKNIGGARKGIEDMGVLGNPGKYSSVLAENEEASPWPPLHVENNSGVSLGKEESAVTVFFPNCYSQILPYGSDDKGILNALIYNLQPGRGGMTCLVLTPTHARILAKAGWTKQKIKNFVAEFARVPAYRHRSYHDHSLAYGRPGMTPMNPMDSMSIVTHPGLIEIIVAGGAGAFLGILCSSANNETFVTKKITLPAGWGRIVARYKNYVPAYERY
jgi:hypothetical protein